jgi:hypothetical protein
VSKAYAMNPLTLRGKANTLKSYLIRWNFDAGAEMTPCGKILTLPHSPLNY